MIRENDIVRWRYATSRYSPKLADRYIGIVKSHTTTPFVKVLFNDGHEAILHQDDLIKLPKIK